MNFLTKSFYNCVYHLLLSLRGSDSAKLTGNYLGDDNILASCLYRLDALALRRGIRNFALYGAGKHSERILSLDILQREGIVAIFDDNPQTDNFLGLQVLPVGKALELDFDALIISSDLHWPKMIEKARDWLPAGKILLCPYLRKVEVIEK